MMMKASSLIEVLVSLSLISLTISLGLGLLSRQVGIQNPVQRWLSWEIGDHALYSSADCSTPILGRRIIRDTLSPSPFQQWVEVKVYHGPKRVYHHSRLLPSSPRP